MLCAFALPAMAADLDWQIVTGTSTGAIEREVQRWASTGYRVQALVADAPVPTVLIAREGRAFRRMPPSAEYRVLDPRDAAEVPALGAEGFRLRALAKARSGPALAIFERMLSPRGAPHDYRSLQAPPAGDVDPLLAAAANDGYRVAGSVGDAGSEWLILERDRAARGEAAAPAAARESRVITAEDVEALEAAINRLASDGFACDAVWNRPPKGLALFKGGALMAALSRRRGVTSPAAHVTMSKGRQPSGSGQLIAMVPYRNSFAFVIRRATETDHAVHEVTFPTETGSSSWQDDSVLERLRSQWWSELDLAWAITSSGKVSSWMGLERREPVMRASSRTVARREAEAIPVPAGATALPRGGGDPGDAYRAHLAAIARGDLAGAKALWTGAQRASWEKRVKDFKAPLGMGFSEKDLFQSLRKGLATDMIVLGGWLAGDRAQLRLEGTHDGVRSIAEIDMTRDAGSWKIASQHPWRPVAN